MDELNAHQLWGISPAVDLTAVSLAADQNDAGPEEPLRILQVASYDARHTLYSIARIARHASLLGTRPLHIFVYEEDSEALARHLLLLSILLDPQLLPRERVELLLELHSNALVREKTAAYVEARGRALEALLVSLSSRGELPTAAAANSKDGAMCDPATSLLGPHLDVSLLKFQDRDALVEVLQKYRGSVSYDMVKAWDARARKWYGERFDFRRNMIDWDYHMMLAKAGTPGQNPELGSIIHFHHFRHWRTHGIAYELRDANFSHPNRSMLTTAYGRTREFKDRNGKDVGRSVSAWGYWGDILNGPYHCFGTVCEDGSYYSVTNKQFGRTAVDIAEHNIMALLHELRTGTKYEPSGKEAHRARVARGPTSLADLQEQASERQKVQEKVKEMGLDTGDSSSKQKDQNAKQEEEQRQQDGKLGQSSSSTPDTQASVQQQSSVQAGAGTPALVTEPAAAPPQGEAHANASSNANSSSSGSSQPDFEASATFKGPRPGFTFKRGPRGIGYYKDNKAQVQQQQQPVSEAQAQTAQEQQQQAGEEGRGQQRKQQVGSSSAAGLQEGQQQGSSESIQADAAGLAAVPPRATEASGSGSSAEAAGGANGAVAGATGEAGNGDSSSEAAEVRAQMAAEEEALRAQEAELDAAAVARLKVIGLRIIPVLGSGGGSTGPAGLGTQGAAAGGKTSSDLAKLLTGKAKYAGAFSVVSLGHRHIHLLGSEHQLLKATRPGGMLVAEGAKYMLQLKAEQAEAFAGKIKELAKGAGWVDPPAAVAAALAAPAPGSTSGMVLTDAHLLFQKPVHQQQ